MGIFAVIAPFNFPSALVVNMITGALITGNTVVFKPSPGCGLTGRLVVDAFIEAGLPEGAVNFVAGGDEVGRRLIEHPHVDGVAFTGSHEAGMAIFRTFATGQYARPVIAEMGGKNPAYVTATANLDAAAEGIARSAFGLQGQKCSACSVAYVDARVKGEFLDKLAAFAGKLEIGDPRKRNVFMGPIYGEKSAERFAKAVREAKGAGSVRHGGERLRGDFMDRGYYLQPTVVDLPGEHRLTREELFIPFVAIRGFDRLEDAIAEGNRVAYGLSAGIYSTEDAEVDLFLDAAQAGVLYANRASGATTGAWPGVQSFCGWKGSGVSSKGGLGPYYLQQFMREQSHTLIR
jgi:1-pyrroline-5-carboxylate dehydrogenase